MPKRLFRFYICPGDPDHIPSGAIEEGIVEATDQEAVAIRVELGRHLMGDASIRAVEDAAIDLDEFKARVGSALECFHGEMKGEPPCELDRPYVEAHLARAYGKGRAQKMVSEAYARQRAGGGFDSSRRWNG